MNNRQLATTQSSLILTDSRRRPSDRHPAVVYIAALAAGSRETMRSSLDRVADLLSNDQANALTLDWAALRFQHTSLVRSMLADLYAPATANKMLSALRGALKAAWRLQLMDTDDYMRAIDFETIAGKALKAGREIPDEEIAFLMQACARDPKPAGVRDAAIFAVLRVGGLRRAEVRALRLSHYATDGKLTVLGKGKKTRVVYIVSDGAVRALDDWLKVRGRSPGPLFCSIRKGGKIVIRKSLEVSSFNYILNQRVMQAGIKDPITPHDFRRTLVSLLLDKGEDLVVVSRLLGHASIKTTEGYDRRPDQVVRDAAARVDVPWGGDDDD